VSIYRFIDEAEKEEKASYRVSMCCVQGLLCRVCCVQGVLKVSRGAATTLGKTEAAFESRARENAVLSLNGSGRSTTDRKHRNTYGRLPQHSMPNSGLLGIHCKPYVSGWRGFFLCERMGLVVVVVVVEAACEGVVGGSTPPARTTL
jgi:hypothetical protein